MEQETNSNFDICNLLSGGTLGEFKSLFDNVVKLLNETKAVDKNKEPLKYEQSLLKTKKELEKLILEFEKFVAEFPEGEIKENCKEKFYELAGQIYAMYASNMEQPKFEDKALEYYKKYQIILQRYKIDMTLENKNDIVVYSFRKYSIFTLEDLINNTITVVSPSKMNDPFDSIANYWRKTDSLEKITGGIGHEKMLKKSMDYFRIRSFQANTATYNTHDSILQDVKMWSNYADNHYGFCIKYRLSKKFFRVVDETAEISLRVAPIQYVPYYCVDSNKKTLNTFDAYFVKNKAWKEEGEIRLLSYNPKIEDDHWGVPMGNDAKIEEVIFGYLCTDDCKKTIYNLLSPKGVSFYMMKPTPKIDIYHLVKEEYHPHPKEK